MYNWRGYRQKDPEIMWFKNDIEVLKNAFWQSKEGPEFVHTMDMIERLALERYERADRFREKHGLDDSIFDEEHIQTGVVQSKYSAERIWMEDGKIESVERCSVND